MELSSNGSEVRRTKQAVRRVHEDGRRGKGRSKKILGEIKESTLDNIMGEEGSSNIVQVNPLVFEDIEPPVESRVRERRRKDPGNEKHNHSR